MAELQNYIGSEVPSGTVNGINRVFNLAHTPIAGTVSVFLNGLFQDPGAGNDFTLSGGTITFETAPETGDMILASYYY